jgi:hypothetical protein
LMSRDHGVARRDEASFGDIEIRAAHGARRYANEYLVFSGRRDRNVVELERSKGSVGRRPWMSQEHRSHHPSECFTAN